MPRSSERRLQVTATCVLTLLALIGFFLVPSAGAEHHAADPPAVDPEILEADLAQMVEWFSGRFDNHWQHREEESADEPVEHPHGRIHSIFHPVEMPELGEHVFYVQQYSDNDPTKIYRQRLYHIFGNEETGEVMLVIYAVPDAKAVVDAHLDPSKLAGLAKADLKSYPGCEVYWTRKNRGGEDDHFLGFTKEGACVVVSSRSGRTLIISDDLRLDANQIWIQDRAVDSDGNWIYGNKAMVPHKLWKARPFTCWAAIKKTEEEMEGADPEASEWHGFRGLKMHDQGEVAELKPDGAESARYSFELFQAVYRGASTVPVLELAVREEGQEKSIAYAWASPDSARIGINLRYLQVGCTRDDS